VGTWRFPFVWLSVLGDLPGTMELRAVRDGADPGLLLTPAVGRVARRTSPPDFRVTMDSVPKIRS